MATSKEKEIEDLPAEELPAEELPAEEVEDAPKPKAKAKAVAKEPRAKSGKEAKADEEKEERAEKRSRREADPNAPKLPYPPPPADVPEDLTEFPESFKRQMNFLLAGLFMFLTFYIGTILLSALIGVWCVWSLWHWFPLKVIGLFFSSLTFLFLVKGFFKRHAMNRDMNVELTEKEYPTLFEFIHQLCDEVGAKPPNKVLVSPDVNAMCITHTSLFSLFTEPKKDVLIGLGLVNGVNLSEFKAILAHEFGHFSHQGQTSNYVHVVQNLVVDMIRGEDWFDRFVMWCKRNKNMAWLGHMIGGPLWVGRAILVWFYHRIAFQRQALSREKEFHADLIAVSAAGSDAATHGLLRARFAMECFVQAVNDLVVAMDHKLYSNDLYLHQDRAASVVRRKKKEPEMGLPPVLSHPAAGQTIKVFDAEQEAMEDNDRTPPMWRSHPSDADREESVKRRFVATPLDHRSPWLVFDNAADLRERMTYKFYRMALKIPKNTDLDDAKKVQTFIDNEHADTTYDPKYNGIYDDRALQPVAPDKDGRPGDLNELNQLVIEKPWDDDRIEKVLGKLYDGCRAKAEELDELRKDRAIHDNTPGKKSKRTKNKIAEIDEKLDTLWEWLRSHDRRVYLIHVQMAGSVNAEWKSELIERYRFQLEVQRLYSESRYNQERALAFARLLFSLPPDKVHPELGAEVMSILRQSWRSLKKIIQDARDINLPAMKNFEEGENLADFILEGKMVPEPPLSYVRLDWCQKLVDQLAAVRSKCFRLHTKSLGGILALQEQVVAKWKVEREPIGAEVVEVEPVEAEVIAVEVVPAEVMEAEVVAAEVIEAEEVPAEVVEAEEVPAEVIAAEVVSEELPVPAVPSPVAVPEPPKVLAAFVALAPAPAAPELHSSPPSPAPVEPAPRAVVFDFDAVAPEPVAKAVSAPAAAPASLALDAKPAAVVADGAFSLDADAPVSVPAPAVVEAKLPVAAQPEPTNAVDPAKMKAEKEAREREAAEKEKAALVLSGLVEVPAPRTVAPAASKAAPVAPQVEVPKPVVTPGVKPSDGKRPAIRITLVRPGEKSPFAK